MLKSKTYENDIRVALLTDKKKKLTKEELEKKMASAPVYKPPPKKQLKEDLGTKAAVKPNQK